jgi:integration host factor subunit alpha
MSGHDFTLAPKSVANGAVRGYPTEDEDLPRGTLTRMHLAEAVHRAVGVPRVEASRCVEAVLDEIFETLVHREDVKLSSFGTFLVRSKRERAGRNPKTGVGARISARLVVVFKASNLLRARINHGVEEDGEI